MATVVEAIVVMLWFGGWTALAVWLERHQLDHPRLERNVVPLLTLISQ